MAILVEEEKKPVNWIGLISTIVIVVAVFGGGYYLFFSAPDKIDIVLPDALQGIAPIVDIKFEPKTLLDPASGERSAKIFRMLSDHTSPINIPAPGKDNPFRPL
jgi:hypothetical protein